MRRGSVIAPVLCGLVVAALTALAFHGRALDSARLAGRAHDRAVACRAAESARACLLVRLRAELAPGSGSRLGRWLIDSDAESLEGRAVPAPSGWDAPLRDSLREMGATAVSAEVHLREVRALGAGLDPLEKGGLLELAFEVRVRTTELTFRYFVPFKIVNLVAPVTAKFTLFVARPEPGVAYDLHANRQDGSPAEGGDNPQPLVLSHDDGRGWVYFGGEAPVQLHLAAGADAAAMHDRSSERLFGGCTLRRRYEGFFEGMYAGGRLQRDLAAGRPSGSSVLCLAGGREEPSPTHVFGPVQRCYVELTDLDGDGWSAPLPGVEWYDYPWRLPPLPCASHGLDGAGQEFTGLFGEYSGYARVMSRVVAEPFDPAGAPRAFALADAHGRSLYRGDPGDVAADALAARVVVEVADEAAFLARYVSGGKLSLDRVVRLTRGDLHLPPRLEVEHGGMVIVPGTITSAGVAAPAGPPLTLCSLAGDLVLDGGSARHELCGIALAGRLRGGARDALDVHGALAVRTLDPREIHAGGRIAYDARLDATSPAYRTFFRAFIADRDDRWELP